MQDQLTAQAEQIADLQHDLAQVMTSFQQTKSDVNDCCGTYGSTGQTDDGPQIMDGVELEQNTPNPFEAFTIISFEIPADAQVRVEISDSAGRILETIHNGRLARGHHQVRWEASRYPSGVYYYSLYADTVLLTKKMIKK